MNYKKIIKDKRAQVDGASTIYMLIIVAIVAVVLLAVIKPMFNKATKTQVKVPTD